MAIVSRGGLTGIILIGCLLYFTNAGNWLWGKIKTLDQNCYSALVSAGASIANPICGAVSTSIEGINRATVVIKDKLNWQVGMVGRTNLDALDVFADKLEDRIGSLASPSDTLNKMMQNGPYGWGGATPKEQLQQAIDSYTIAQSYLGNRMTTELALPWLQQGAQQKDGYGLMSQLTLGNIYVQGQGVPEDPQMAQGYLMQARTSLDQLTSSRSPEAKQLLQSLPARPETVRQQLDQAIQTLRQAQK